MKIRYFVITAVLATAILCFGANVNVANAACSAGNQQICDLNAQIDALQAQMPTVCPTGQAVTANCLMLQIQILQLQLQVMQLQQGTTQTWCHTFNTNLGYAQSGSDEVGYLHTALDKEGISYSSDTGNTYSEPTMSAVVQFQAKYGISQTGYLGPLTRSKLNALYGCGITTCPQYVPPAPGWCSGGTIIPATGFDLNGCPNVARCVYGTNITINSVSGPNSLNISQTGTWTVNATAPSGTNLTYRVAWGEYGGYAGISSLPMPAGLINQTGTFTHAYANAGTYTARFIVYGGYNCTDPTTGAPNPACSSTQTSITVVVGNTGQPSITVTSPNGGEILTAGQQYTIKWTDSNLPLTDKVDGSPVFFDIYIFNGGKQSNSYISDEPAFLIADHVPITATSYTWTVQPNTGQYGYPVGMASFSQQLAKFLGISSADAASNQYTIQVMTVNGNPAADGTSGVFTINPASTQPSITVTSPNGGEVWTRGSTHTIIWNNNANLRVINIDLLKGNVPVQGITQISVTSTLPIPTSYSWVVDPKGYNGSSLPDGNDYSIRVRSSDGTISDTGDNYFSIVAPTTTPSITVTSPNGDSWTRGTQKQITWSSNGISGDSKVDISLFKEGIDSWYDIANVYNRPFNTGSFAWEVGKNSEGGTIPDGSYWVRVCNLTRTACNTSSGGHVVIVTVTQPSITVTSPNGGEAWKVGETHIITWQPKWIGLATGGNVVINLSDSSKSVTYYIAQVPAALGTYTWTIPATISGNSIIGSQFKILMVDDIDNAADTSDNYFTINPALNYTANLTINNQTTGSFKVGDAWTLRVATDPRMGANQPVTICAKDTVNPSHPTTSCTPAGQMSLPANADTSGNWTGPGSFPASTIGNWIEYAKVGSGSTQVISNDISFTVNAATPVCTDSDVTSAYPDGKNYNTQGTITVGTITASDHCTADGKYVYEYFCSSNTADNRGYDFVSYACPNGCSNGACIAAVASTSACADSDVTSAYPDGKNYYVKGFVIDQYTAQLPNGSISDSCLTKNVPDNGGGNFVNSCNGSNCFVQEFYCIGDNHNSVSFPCPNGCFYGVCTAPPISLNSSQSSLASIADAVAKIAAQVQAMLLNKQFFAYLKRARSNLARFCIQIIDSPFL